MCHYSYIYYSACQHGSLNRLSYCDRAKALGLPRLDGRSPKRDGADNSPANTSGPSSSLPPASSAKDNSTSHRHNQQQLTHNMATLTQSGAAANFSRHAASAQTNKELSPRAALVPRSALSDHHGTAQDYQVSPSTTTRYDSVSGAGSMRGPPSPRKPIPAQWLPERSAPNLATAQRAKERGHKKGSLSGSPIEMKTLRGTRSSVDMAKAYGSEGATFLTKDALTTVESDITSPISRSPTKHSRTSSKPAWHSPGTSPLRESPRQQSSLFLRTSPAKKASSQTGSLGRHGPSSVATSTGDSVFHSAEGSVFHSAEMSPVRSSADSELSFQTADFLHPDDAHIPLLQLNADIEDAQAVRCPANTPSSANKSLDRDVLFTRPKLTVDTAVSSQFVRASDISSPSESSATSNSTAGGSPWSVNSATSSSRIPRAAGGSVSAARGPTLSSTLKRAQSSKSLTSTNVKSQRNEPASHPVLQPRTPPTASLRQVRTINSSGRTPILSRRPTVERFPTMSILLADPTADNLPAHDTQATLAHVTSSLNRLRVDQPEQPVSNHGEQTPAQSSRASSMSTVKATPSVVDPSMVDSAIIYSKVSSASGTILDRPIHNPPLIVMMAHNFDLGTFSAQDVPYTNRIVSSDLPVNSNGRSQPVGHPRAESEHSLQSSQTSDLRPTAAEFIPKTAPGGTDVKVVSTETLAKPAVDPNADLLADKKFELDMHGIPWFYYMYQVQFAFEQGFNYGRSKSPKKFRNRKSRSSVASPTDGQPQQNRSTDMPPSASTVPLAEQRAQKKRNNSSIDVAAPDEVSIESRPFSPFFAQKDAIARQTGFQDITNNPRAHPFDLTTIRNVPSYTGHYGMQSQPGYHNTMPHRGNHFNNRRGYYRSDNGLYTQGGRGMVGVPMHSTDPFPNPIPPQGRPIGCDSGNSRGMAPVPDYRNAVGSEACGMVNIVTAAERVGGEACNRCEPDHPMDG